MSKVICPNYDKCNNDFCFHRNPHKECADCFPKTFIEKALGMLRGVHPLCALGLEVKRCIPCERKKF